MSVHVIASRLRVLPTSGEQDAQDRREQVGKTRNLDANEVALA
jgi:hypothetical protein